MIAGLNGKLEALGNNWALINVNGVSFQVFMPTSTLAVLGGIGDPVKVFTQLVLREDSIALYGFGSSEELALFQILTSVSGVGPKLGLSMLSARDPEQLATSIASGNADLLRGIPGIGKKIAERVILELKDKVSTTWALTPQLESVRENSDVLAALTALGYSVSEAIRAVGTIPPSSTLSVEEKVKLALHSFERK